MGRDDDSRRPRSLGTADDRAEVVRVGDLVEACQQGTIGGGQLPAVGVLVGLAPGEHALVIARAGGLTELALGLDLNSRAVEVGQPGLRLHGALGRPQLEHFSPAA